MTEEDLPALIDLQQAGAIAGLAAVFPQDRYPFPREAIAARWREEICDPAIDTYVAVDVRGHLVGFAATTGSELLHFGTAIKTWGGGRRANCTTSWSAGCAPATASRCSSSSPTTDALVVSTSSTDGTRLARLVSGIFPPYPPLLEYTLPAPWGSGGTAQRSMTGDPMSPVVLAVLERLIGSIDDCNRVNLDHLGRLGRRLHSHQGVSGLVVTE